MFIQPNGRGRNTNSHSKATGPILMGFGVLIFLTMIHLYTARVMPTARMAQAAPDDFRDHRDHVILTPASDFDEGNIRSVISQQTHAFKRKNFAEAMGYASVPFPEVTPAMYQNFLQSRYPENAAPRTVTCLDRAMIFEHNFALQRVRVVGQDGTTVPELYLMIATDSGWRVRRMRIVPADATAADYEPWSDGP